MQNFSTILILYILMPLLAILAGIIGYLYAKKKKLAVNRKTIFILLLVSLMLALPGLLGFFSHSFMPLIYVLLIPVYILAGYGCSRLLKKLLPEQVTGEKGKNNTFWAILLIQFVIMFIGMGFFSLFFNLTSELKYGVWAGSCLLPFILPNLFRQTWVQYLSIPPEIYEIWKCTGKEDLSPFKDMDLTGLMVLELEITKSPDDKNKAAIKAKAPKDMPFGIWFYKFLQDYNIKFPLNKIEYENPAHPYGWIFYSSNSIFLSRKYIDHNKTIAENNIQESDIIIAKRVSENTHKELNL